MSETVVRGATRTVRPEGPIDFYVRDGDRSRGTITSYAGQPVPWRAQVVFYGAHGKLASLRLRYAKAGGAYLYCASAFSASCGMSAQRRS